MQRCDNCVITRRHTWDIATNVIVVQLYKQLPQCPWSNPDKYGYFVRYTICCIAAIFIVVPMVMYNAWGFVPCGIIVRWIHIQCWRKLIHQPSLGDPRTQLSYHCELPYSVQQKSNDYRIKLYFMDERHISRSLKINVMTFTRYLDYEFGGLKIYSN